LVVLFSLFKSPVICYDKGIGQKSERVCFKVLFTLFKRLFYVVGITWSKTFLLVAESLPLRHTKSEALAEKAKRS